MILLDLHPEADAAVPVRFVPNVHDARSAAHFLGRIAGHFRGHSKGRFDGHADLERSRGREEKPAPGNIERLGKMFGFICSYAHGAETEGRPVVDPRELSALTGSHDVLLRREQGVTRTREKEGYSKRIREIGVVKYQR